MELILTAIVAVLGYIMVSKVFVSAKAKEQGVLDDLNENFRTSIKSNTISKKLDVVAKFETVKDPKGLLDKANELLAQA